MLIAFKRQAVWLKSSERDLWVSILSLPPGWQSDPAPLISGAWVSCLLEEEDMGGGLTPGGWDVKGRQSW